MIKLNLLPNNKEHYLKLLQFCEEILDACRELTIVPILNAGLAVFAYTQNQKMDVNDIDLACSESDFPRLFEALEAKGIDCKVTDWHVLQARKGDLKIEFDSVEYWMKGIPQEFDYIEIEKLRMRIIGLDGLRELYKQGMDDTQNKDDKVNKSKYKKYKQKYEQLSALG
ncbi:MAG: hypothetical protein AAB896_00730 [Patescibacteria group bacterium]